MWKKNLDRSITIQSLTESRSASGSTTFTTTTLATVAAEVVDDSEVEAHAGPSQQALGTRIFRIRYRDDVTYKHVISFKSVTHDIGSIKELGRREGLEIRATARVL